MKHNWSVTVPIAGHAFIEVEAETEHEAIEIALNEITSDNLESWEALETFCEGNVLYCPRPWSAEAVDEGPSEDADDA